MKCYYFSSKYLTLMSCAHCLLQEYFSFQSMMSRVSFGFHGPKSAALKRLAHPMWQFQTLARLYIGDFRPVRLQKKSPQAWSFCLAVCYKSFIEETFWPRVYLVFLTREYFQKQRPHFVKCSSKLSQSSIMVSLHPVVIFQTRGAFSFYLNSSVNN